MGALAEHSTSRTAPVKPKHGKEMRFPAAVRISRLRHRLRGHRFCQLRVAWGFRLRARDAWGRYAFFDISRPTSSSKPTTTATARVVAVPTPP